MTDYDAQLLLVFRDELAESLEDINLALETLARAPGDEARALKQRLFRTLHNVKGAARLVGLSEVELVAHALEDGIAPHRHDAEALPDELVALLERGMQYIRQLAEGEDVSSPALALVEQLADAHLAATELATAEAHGTTSPEHRPDTPQERPEQARPQQASVRVLTQRLDRLITFSGEFLAFKSRLETRQGELERWVASLDKVARELPAATRDRLRALSRDLERRIDVEGEELESFAQLSSDFSATLKSLRMRRLGELVPLWRQGVGKVADALDRSVRFVANVGDIEIDRGILDDLRDPLMHLLNNAVAHGIESPEARRAAGKPAQGVVDVSARAVGTMVEIEVCDDGSGIDLEAIAARAADARAPGHETAPELSDAQAMELLFAPGFSTTEDVGRISGRGVGLDVVRERLVRLGGHVELSPVGRLGGASFRLTVPASLVSTRGLLVRTDRQTYVLPNAQVEGTLRVAASEVQPTAGGVCVQGAEGPLMLQWLATLMDEPREPDAEYLNVLVLNDPPRKLGLVVRQVRGELEYVAQALPWNLDAVPGVAGAILLGDGTVSAVLNASELVQRGLSPTATRGGLVRADQRETARVLVVDDSLTSRTLERGILAAAGYDVEVAIDGDVAWHYLQQHEVDLVVADVEMPNVDGIELTRRIRASDMLKNLPVILVTSLESPDDVAAGAEAGADEYIVKGRFDQRKLLDAVKRLV